MQKFWPKMYEVHFTNKSRKEIKKIAEFDKKNLLKRISSLDFPFPANLDISKMTEIEGFYRLRSGNIRTLFEVDQKKKEIWIRKIKYRGQIYKH